MVLIQLNATIINSSSQLGEEKQPCRNGNAYVEKRCIGVINIKKCIIDIQEKFSLNMFHNKMCTINGFLVNCTDYWAISNKTIFLHFLTQTMYNFLLLFYVHISFFR